MKFKKGDKVLVYGNYGRPKDDPMQPYIGYTAGRIGVVSCVTTCLGEIFVKIKADKTKRYPKSFEVSVHEKQCRKVKK